MGISESASSEQEFGEIFARDYYEAESYALDLSPKNRSFHLSTASSGAVPVARFTGCPLGVRRTWRHIRNGPSNLYVIWFPLQGSLRVTQDEANGTPVSVQEMVITYGDRPFHIKALNGLAGENCSQLHIIVPKHMMRTFLPEIDRLCAKPFPADQGTARVVRDTFLNLAQEASALSAQVANNLTLTLLETLFSYIRQHAADDLKRGAQHAQCEKILAFIRENMSVQGLLVEHVANGCNMSRRYIHYTLKNHNLTFSHTLRKIRLNQAHEWLTDVSFAHFNVIDIAYMVGFKSASHFSKSYHSQFGIPPKLARAKSIQAR